MPLFLAALMGALVTAAGSIVGRVLLSLGIGYASYAGIDTSITFVRDYVVSSIGATSAQTIAAASACKVGTCISIITSALVARMTLNGMTSGVLKKFTMK